MDMFDGIGIGHAISQMKRNHARSIQKWMDHASDLEHKIEKLSDHASDLKKQLKEWAKYARGLEGQLKAWTEHGRSQNNQLGKLSAQLNKSEQECTELKDQLADVVALHMFSVLYAVGTLDEKTKALIAHRYEECLPVILNSMPDVHPIKHIFSNGEPAVPFEDVIKDVASRYSNSKEHEAVQHDDETASEPGSKP